MTPRFHEILRKRLPPPSVHAGGSGMDSPAEIITYSPETFISNQLPTPQSPDQGIHLAPSKKLLAALCSGAPCSTEPKFDFGLSENGRSRNKHDTNSQKHMCQSPRFAPTPPKKSSRLIGILASKLSCSYRVHILSPCPKHPTRSQPQLAAIQEYSTWSFLWHTQHTTRNVRSH